MTRGTVWEPRRTQPDDRPDRSRRELHDVRHPLQPGLRVERVLVCPSGVHVVTSAPPSLAGDRPDAVLVAAARAAADVVAGLLPVRYRDRVRPVLCHLDAPPMADLVDDVLVTTPSTLEHVVSSLPVRLSTSEVGDVVRRLEAGLEPFPVPAPEPASRWSRRRVVAGLAAAAVATAVAGGGVAAGIDGLPLPW